MTSRDAKRKAAKTPEGGRADTCRRRSRLVIDHDHANHYVRAPLYGPDNIIEGLLKKIGIRTYDQLLGGVPASRSVRWPTTSAAPCRR